MEKKGRGKKSVFVAVILIAAILGGMAVGFFVLPTFSSANAAVGAFSSGANAINEAKRSKEAAAIEPGMMYALKERVVNLADPNGPRYLKIELVLEFDLPETRGMKAEAYKKRQDEFIKEMASRRPIMDDVVTSVLAGKTWAALSGVDGKERLRDELKGRLSEVAGEHKVLNVYIIQFIIQ